MPKAKSRLATTPIQTELPPIQPVIKPKAKVTAMTRLKHLPTLVLGIIFGLSLLALIIFVAPDSVKNWLIPNSYLPFFVCLFGTNFFIFSFVFLDSAIGMWWTLLVCSFAFLKLQQVIFTWPMVVVFLLGAALGLFFQILRRRHRLNKVNQSSK